jgi:F0F1-type ATP synthase delta subunit
MTKAIVKKLVEESYKDGALIPEIVEYIASKLSRKDLKVYIKLLKEEEIKKQVFVTSAEALSKADLEKIKQLYPGKTITSAIDKAMISGVRIVENNKEYEVNLNRTFHDIIGFLSTND